MFGKLLRGHFDGESGTKFDFAPMQTILGGAMYSLTHGAIFKIDTKSECATAFCNFVIEQGVPPTLDPLSPFAQDNGNNVFCSHMAYLMKGKTSIVFLK